MIIHSVLLLMASVCSMGYELLISKIFFEIGFDETLSLTIPIGFYLLGMGIGTLRVKKDDLYKQLFKIELVLVLLGALIPFIFSIIHTSLQVFILKSDTKAFLQIEFFIFQIIPLLVGYYSGKELQCFFYIFEDKKFRGYGFTLTLSYIGSLAAGLLIPYLISLQVQPIYCSLLLSILNMYILTILYFESGYTKLIKLLSITFSSIIICICLVYGNPFEKFIISALYSEYKSPNLNLNSIKNFVLSTNSIRNIERIRTPYQVIDIIPRDFIKSTTGFTSPFTIYLNLKPQFDSESYHGYHQTMVVGSKNLAKIKNIKTALVLGGGDGLLNSELLKRFPNLEQITQIELDSKIVKLATIHPEITLLNNDSFKNSKINLIISDALTYLRNTSENFDAIYIDFPLPSTLDLSKLYTKEFYLLCMKHLNKNGFITFDVPTLNQNLNPRNLSITRNHKVLYATLISTGCSNISFYGPLESFGFCQPNSTQTNFDYNELSKENLHSSVYINMLKIPNPKMDNAELSKNINSIFKLKRFDVL
jgi:spermidine synthase